MLAIAALRRGVRVAYAFDHDPQAARETRENAELNGVGGGLRVWCGSLASCQLGAVDLAIANLLRRELLPLLPDLAALLADRGWLWVSGLLQSDLAEVEAMLGRLSLHLRERLERREDGEHWVALGISR